jgi:hypothetical protein
MVPPGAAPAAITKKQSEPSASTRGECPVDYFSPN